jgi:hypothetical protein
MIAQECDVTAPVVLNQLFPGCGSEPTGFSFTYRCLPRGRPSLQLRREQSTEDDAGVSGENIVVQLLSCQAPNEDCQAGGIQSARPIRRLRKS